MFFAYKIYDQQGRCFFTRDEYKYILVNSLKYCKNDYAWAIMINLFYLIIGTSKDDLRSIWLQIPAPEA